MALGKPAATFAFACALCASSHAQTVGDLIGSDSTVVMVAGGSISAKDTAATLKLARGGELRICPHSSVSLSASNDGHDLVIGMLGAGAIETDYVLGTSVDTLLTPDFRIRLQGPGVSHFAVASDVHGNTCVRSLPGNNSSLVVNELLGDGVYPVRSGDQVVFHNGRISETDLLVPPDCGCGPPQAPVQRTENPPVPAAIQATKPVIPASPAKSVTEPTPPKPGVTPTASREVTRPQLGSVSGAEPEPVPGLDTPPLGLPGPVNSTLRQPGTMPETLITVDAPFVFRAEEASLPPPPIVATVSLSHMPDLRIPSVQPLPPRVATVAAPDAKSNASGRPADEPRQGGFFTKLGALFAGLFGKHH